MHLPIVLRHKGAPPAPPAPTYPDNYPPGVGATGYEHPFLWLPFVEGTGSSYAEPAPDPGVGTLLYHGTDETPTLAAGSLANGMGWSAQPGGGLWRWGAGDAHLTETAEKPFSAIGGASGGVTVLAFIQAWNEGNDRCYFDSMDYTAGAYRGLRFGLGGNNKPLVYIGNGTNLAPWAPEYGGTEDLVVPNGAVAFIGASIRPAMNDEIDFFTNEHSHQRFLTAGDTANWNEQAGSRIDLCTRRDGNEGTYGALMCLAVYPNALEVSDVQTVRDWMKAHMIARGLTVPW